MGKILVIAEKPSLGRSIAGAISWWKGEKFERQGKDRNTWLESDNYIVVSLVGHLYELIDFDAYFPGYDPAVKQPWDLKKLPFFPDDWKFKFEGKEKVQGLIKVANQQMNRKDVDAIYNAGDPDREGQRLVDEVLLYGLKAPKTIYRLWLPDTTNKTIKQAFETAKPNAGYVSLSSSAETRSEIDWLLGIELTRYVSIKAGGFTRIGRCVCPIVQHIIEREKAIKEFVPKPYSAVSSKEKTNGEEIELTSKRTFEEGHEAEAQALADALAINPWVLQDFLEVNGIDAMQPMTIAKGLAPELRDIRYANDSEIVWYEFSTCNTTKRCTNLSRAKNFVRDWVNYDCPTLYRYTTNQKNVIINGFGITLPVFSNVLVDTYDCKFQLDDTLTEKEINALLKHLNPKGAVAEHLNFAKKANEMGQDALWKLREEVKDTCKAINDLLHEPATRDAILKAQTEHQRDAMPMMDCGWLNWFPLEGTEFAEKFNTVRSTGNGPYFLDIDMPIIDQSVNVQSYGGDVVRDLVSKRLGIDIYYVRHLD